MLLGYRKLCGLLKVQAVLIGFLALALYVSGCPRPLPAIDPNPYVNEPTDGGREYTCADACQRGYQLGCPFAEPVDGASCLDVCVMSKTKSAPWNLTCRSNITSCKGAYACQ